MKQLFCDGLRQFGLTFTDPQGAYYVLLDVSKYGVKDDLHFCVVANSAYSQKPNAPNSARGTISNASSTCVRQWRQPSFQTRCLKE